MQGEYGGHVMVCNLAATDPDQFVIEDVDNKFGRGGKFNVVSTGDDIVHYDRSRGTITKRNPEMASAS